MNKITLDLLDNSGFNMFNNYLFALGIMIFCWHPPQYSLDGTYTYSDKNGTVVITIKQ